ncbi:MAG: hypothetical protein ACQEXX_19910 [Bacillota bacterium]
MTVTASTFWVWTQKSQDLEPKRHRAGERVWKHNQINAPAKWLEDELICDESEFVKEGQADIFEYM